MNIIIILYYINMYSIKDKTIEFKDEFNINRNGVRS